MSALEELVKVWREAADAYHTQAEANRSHGKDALQNQIYCGAYQNCADSLERALLATALPEQAAPLDDSFAEIVKDLREAKVYGPNGQPILEALNWIAYRIERALAAHDQKVPLAAWMIENSFATGHGDTVEDLLKELKWQIEERDQKVRAETLEEAGKHRPVIYILSHDEEALSTKFCCTECSWIGTVEEWREHIRSLAGAVRRKSK